MENSDYNAALQDVLKLIDTYLSNTDNVVEESVLYQLQENIKVHYSIYFLYICGVNKYKIK